MWNVNWFTNGSSTLSKSYTSSIKNNRQYNEALFTYYATNNSLKTGIMLAPREV